VPNDESEWIVSKNTHEPLVDEHTFELAQKVTVVKRRTRTGEPHIFSGLLRCGTCDKAMHYLIRTGRSYTASYSCTTFSRYGKTYCSMHYIRYEDLYSIVLNDIRRYAELAKNHERKLVEALKKSRIDSTEKQLAQYKRDIDKAEKRLSEISLIIKKLYEDSAIGKLTDERFYEMSKGYEIESAELKGFVREAQQAISTQREADSNSQRFTDLVKKYFEVEELNAVMLNELIGKIIIHERDVSEGERRQKIEVYYNFVGNLGDGEHTLGDRRWLEYRSEKYPPMPIYKGKTAATS